MSDNSSGAEQGALPPGRVAGAVATGPPLQLAQIVGTDQFVLTRAATSPSAQQQQGAVPPLTQLSTSSPGITRIISLSTLRTSTSSSSPSIVSALRSPHGVRTQLFPPLQAPSQAPAAETTSPVKSSPASSPRKRSRPDELPPGCENLSGIKARVMEHKWARSKCIKESYHEHIAEFFFVESNGNILDYFLWRKRAKTPYFESFQRQNLLEPAPESQDSSVASTEVSSSAETTPVKEVVAIPQRTDRVVQGLSAYLSSVRHPHTQRVTLAPLRLAAVPTPAQAPLSAPPVLAPATSSVTPVPDSPVVAKPLTPVTLATTSTAASIPVTTTPVRPTMTATTTAVTPANKTKSVIGAAISGSGNQEQIVEKAKQEAYVMQRVAELQREGLWSEKRLPKVQETQRPKTHWDFLLEEMVWLAADFAQERKWKKAAAKKCARMVQKHFQEKATAVIKAEKAQEAQLRRIASFIAKEIKTFWASVEKIVEFKQKTRLEEKRKQALDQHLSFIVDQTEKYSQLLAEGMNKSGVSQTGESTTPANSSRLPSPHHSDEEFRPNEDQSSSDDEETIAQAEAADEPDKQNEEIAALQRESQMDLEDFLNELPKDYLENRDKIILSEPERDSDNSTSEDKKKDEDFKVENEESDDEDTIMEQEKAEGNVDHKQELDDLQAENEMSIEELKKKYMSLPPPEDSEDSKQSGDAEEADSEAESSEEEAEDSDDEDSEESEVEVKKEEESEDEDKVGLKMLVEDEANSNSSDKKGDGDGDKIINDVAALAESIQPKGNTLSSTSVVTPVPFLLKHPLREYQHIGLDWLVTMYERKLNGILADEMGLGKTIQTIALLAHLACEKEDWGPHLIIVPTSVMLNWEMECKKWCPGFKILTYYGTQKERKLKRTGWTKPNAFHICITSYKLVIQDHQSFRRKKWKYLILDEAQNIKNFKSQRWQLLLNFQTQQRLLLTGTPLQNNLMELWSLMHFLMPHVFQSHREFKEWFSNPVTGMIEGNSEYNESIIKRLHKVLRPFLLRRLKSEVEKQMPQKFEHIIMCRLSKRQRFLYDDYMSRAKTRETLATGNLLSVINILMQLRKVCNHPNLFEVRPTVSPFQCEGLEYLIPSLIYNALEYDFFKHVNMETLYMHIANMEFQFSAYQAFRLCKYRAPKQLIEMIDEAPTPPPPCPKGLVHMRVKLADPKPSVTTPRTPAGQVRAVLAPKLTPGVKVASPVQQGVKLRVAGPGGTPLQGYSVQIVSHAGGVKAIPVAALATSSSSTTIPTLNIATVGVKTTGDQRVSVPTGFAQLVQTPLGSKHILLTQNASLPQASVSGTTTVMTSSGQRLTVLSKPVAGVATTAAGSKATVVTTATTCTTAATKQANVDSLLESSQAQAASDALSAGVSLSRPLTTTLVQQLKQSGLHPAHTNSNTKYSFTPEPKPKVSHDDTWRLTYNDKTTFSRQSKLAMLWRLNEWRCHASPMYGSDLREVVTMTSRCPNTSWTGGYLTLNAAAAADVSSYNQTRTAIENAVKNVERRVDEMKDIIARFVFCVPAVTAKRIQYRVLNPSQSKYWGEKRDEYMLMRELSPRAAILHTIASATCTQFPDPRLIQYDCGKLQTLDLLLRRLKSGGHRVLIFTQMTRMLDVLEAFLNFHGHIYLRLDGTTKVDQRQVLMERFNGNTKIFAFILSTRSGGVGVNLTGADTVIFYDSDWNPTMDAQAQDRCHRIGQTRDVHIYRLVSEKTIEENILKKANQKRMLGDLAIEGGNFTTAYFKSSTIQDLFDVDTNEDDANARMSEVLTAKSRKEPTASTSETSAPPGPGDDRAAQSALENALAACEDDQDVQAAKTAKAEAVADLAEFDENIPLEETEKEQEMSKAEQELQNIINQLTPVERYAMRFVEATDAAWSAEQLAAAERQIEEQKREWEENRLAALRQEEERRKAQADDDENLLTFSRDDSTNQIWVSDNTKEQMPNKNCSLTKARMEWYGQFLIAAAQLSRSSFFSGEDTKSFTRVFKMWCPPSPPTQETDVYIDYSMGFLYEMSVMSESQLPPVYVRKEPKRSRHEAGLPDSRRALKISRKDELVYEPRSLFDRPSPELVKMRREIKQQRYRGIVRPQLPKFCLKMPQVSKPQPDPPCWHSWMIHEDMALLKVIKNFQGLHLNLMVLYPGHTPNWDFAADYVNSTSITYRSPKQCRHRYETVLISREEGKMLHDTSSRKKKTKNMYTKHPQQFKANRPMRTAQLYTQDNNNSFSQVMIQRFDALKQISSKRPVTTKASTGNAHVKNSKHTQVLSEYGIDYEHPLTPVEVAARRAERIAREKQKLGSITSDRTAAKSSTQVSQPASIVPASPSTSQTPSPGPSTSLTTTQPQTLIVTSQPQVTTTVVTITQPTSQVTTLRTQRIVTSPLQSGTVTGLTHAHLTPQRLIVTGQPVTSKVTSGATTGGTVTVAAASSKAYTPAQLNYYRQQMLKQQQLRVQGVKSVAIGQPTTVQVAVTQGQQRAQFVKQQQITVATAGQAKTGIARPVSETEMAALIKQRQHQLQQKLVVQAAGNAQGSQQLTQAGGSVQTLTQAQLLAQAGIQVQQAGSSGTQVATLVKAVSAAPGGGTSSVTIPVSGVTLGPQVKAAIAAAAQQQQVGKTTTTNLQPGQIRQLQIHQHLLAQKKIGGQKITQLAQVTGKAGVATQLIVQAPKSIPATMTMQQLQQVMRGPQLAAAVSQGGQVVLTAKAAAAAAGQSGTTATTARVIPVNAAGQPQPMKQTIQVVTATSAGQAALVRPQVSVSNTLTGALAGTIKVTPSGTTTTAQQQAILSQVSAALQGQPVTVRQSGSPVRIQTASGTPLVAVTVQQQSAQQSNNPNEQVGHARIQKKQ